MQRRRRAGLPGPLKALLLLGALGAGAWFGRGYLPDPVRGWVEDTGARVEGLVAPQDPDALQVGQRFVYAAGQGAPQTRVEVTRIQPDGEVDVYFSLLRGGQETPGSPPQQKWTLKRTRDMLRGMGLGPLAQEELQVAGRRYACQVYQGPRNPFRVWLADRFPGVIRMEKNGARVLELEHVEQLLPSQRHAWAQPQASWTLGF